MTAGVYSIYNFQTNHMYVGCSSHIEERWERHMHALEDRTHSNRLLQTAYDKTQDVWACIILECCNPQDKYRREQVWIDRMIRHHELYNLDLIVPNDLQLEVKCP